MNRENPPQTPDHVKDGKTLPQQIEGDHAYRDEPPEIEPPEPEIETVYTIHEVHGNTYTTTDHDTARHYSDHGFRVTAETRRKQ